MGSKYTRRDIFTHTQPNNKGKTKGSKNNNNNNKERKKYPKIFRFKYYIQESINLKNISGLTEDIVQTCNGTSIASKNF